MNDNAKVHNGERICLIRTLCNREAFCKILNGFRSSLVFNKDKKYSVSFLSYMGSDYSLEYMLEKNLSIKSVIINSKFVMSTDLDDFIVSPNHRYVFEVIVDEVCDVSDLHYLILLLQYLEAMNENYNILISSSRTKSSRYSPLDTSDYFRISYLLYFYGKKSDDKNINFRTFNKIKAYCNIPNKKSNTNKTDNIKWRRLAVNYETQPKAGKIVPIIPITMESFEALITDFNFTFTPNHSDNMWKELIYGLCNDYIGRISQLDSSILTHEVFELLNSDNCLEAIIFLSTLYYIVENYKTVIPNPNIMSIPNIHELCTDYSQGIVQLIENVVNHVLGKENNEGGGVLSIRFRTKSDAEKNYVKNLSVFDNVNYFMEILLTDFQYYDFNGIVKKFYSNVKKRLLTDTNNEKEILINSKFYFSQMEDNELMEKIVETYGKEILEQIENYIYSLKESSDYKITLSDLFLNDNNVPLKDYLSSSVNIAFHYGLQIFNSVITVGDGYLYVKSGKENADVFTNNTDTYFNIGNLDYMFGTAYIIFIPLKTKQSISFLDSIGVSHNVSQNNGNYISLQEVSKDIFVSKEENSKNFYQIIGESFNQKSLLCSGINVGVLDCHKILKAYDVSKTLVYEIIAKSIFLYLVSEDSEVDNIALVNVENKYDVIKIFRHFALFFDRNGCNHLIKKQKSVFIIDKNGETDILFYGNTIKSISESLCLSQLYGGTDEKAMEIIKCLVRKEYE